MMLQRLSFDPAGKPARAAAGGGTRIRVAA
jgi:hypothetical protein